MKLSTFIKEHLPEIMSEWESFARTSTPAATAMSTSALRDHAAEILRAIALDIDTHQNPEQQQDKSRGLAPGINSEHSAASIHGALRQASDFSLLQLSAEYRALRATVLRLWLPRLTQLSADTSYEMVRFNEAIDQALAESVVTYSAKADQTRELFLAVLGHDLRNPLSAMVASGELLTRADLPPAEVPMLGARIKRSARLMGSMVNDLLGYTRTQLGSGMPVKLEPTDVKEVCESVVVDASATHPASRFELTVAGDLTGSFDGVRLHQLFCNLLVNAAQYGEKSRAILMGARGDADAVIVEVTNYGPVIPEESLEAIFKPLVQLPLDDDSDDRARTSLGLGLFVAREIANAHFGRLHVKSSEIEGTTFTVWLPRSGAGAQHQAEAALLRA